MTARCSVLALRSKQVKFLHFLFLPWASISRTLAPELRARVVLAGWAAAGALRWGRTGWWASLRRRWLPDLQMPVSPCICLGEQFVTLLVKTVAFLSLQRRNPEASCSPRRKGHRSSSFSASKIPPRQSVPFLLLRLTYQGLLHARAGTAFSCFSPHCPPPAGQDSMPGDQ